MLLLPALSLLLLLCACPARHRERDSGGGSNSGSQESGQTPAAPAELSAEQIADLAPAEAYSRLDALGGNLDCDNFIKACADGKLQQVLLYLQAGGDVNCTQPLTSRTSGLIAAADTGQLEVLKALLAHGARADIFETDTNGSPLQLAIKAKHTEAALLLISSGCDLQHADKANYTAMHYAASNGNMEVLKAMIDKGVDPNLPSASGNGNAGGVTPLLMAALEGQDAVVHYLVEEQHADVRRAGNAGGTPLMAALHLKHLELAKYLASKGATPDGYYNDNWTCMSFAAQISYIEGIEWLVSEEHVDVDLRNKTDRRTALILAAEQGSVACCRKLLELGANPDLRDIDGKSARDYARQSGLPELQQLFEQK